MDQVLNLIVPGIVVAGVFLVGVVIGRRMVKQPPAPEDVLADARIEAQAEGLRRLLEQAVPAPPALEVPEPIQAEDVAPINPLRQGELPKLDREISPPQATPPAGGGDPGAQA